ncbi:MAG: FG-GAP repeat domain-containing protein [Blastocatellia bacterium]
MKITRQKITRQWIVWLLIGLTAFSSPGVSQEKAPRWPMFRKHALDSGAYESVAVADVNKDGRLDVIAGENWFEAPAWKKHRLREIATPNGWPDDYSNFAMDVSGDGYPDVIACSWFSKKLAWYENPGKREAGSADVLWKEQTIESGFNYELMLLVDIDGDGQAREILPNYGSSAEVVWFEHVPLSPGKESTASSPAGEWVRRPVGRVPEVKGLHGIGAGDLNRDGRADIITPRGWFEAPENPRAGSWAFHPDFRLLPPRGQCSPIYALDVNSDSKPDLLYGAGHSYGLFWVENKGGQWKEHLIDDSWSQAHAMTVTDLDRDGRPDFVTGKRYLAHEYDAGAYEPLGLYWYRLSGDGSYIKHVIDYGNKTGGGMQIAVVDLDGDGDPDVIAPGKSGLYLFEQVEIQRQKERPPPR